MNIRHAALVLMLLGFTTSAWADQTAKPKAATAKSAQPIIIEPPSPTKVVSYGQKDVVRVNTRVRYTTLIVLPQDEVILDYVCGDKELWVIDGEQNLAYVKPARENSETSLNLVTQSGNLYTFVLSEISATPGKTADLKVFIERTDPVMADAAQSPRRLVSAQELEDSRRETQRAKEDIERLRQDKQEAIEQGITDFVKNVRFAYRFEAGKRPFNVRSMYHDDRFTYVQARPEETPTLMEVRDGKPNLVNFTYANDRYVADRIIDRGYLVIGKEKLHFSRQE